MHDRGDYKSGWELERDWNEEQKKLKEEKERGAAQQEEEEEDDEGIPFACFVCRKGFTDPVKTKCGHYFCERCALKKCKKECAVCSQKTGGAFTMPTRAEKTKLEVAQKKHEAKLAQAKDKENDDEEEDEEA